MQHRKYIYDPTCRKQSQPRTTPERKRMKSRKRKGETKIMRKIPPRGKLYHVGQTEKSGATKKQKGCYRHIQGRSRQPGESAENAKWAIRYNAETEIWKRSQRGKQITAEERRGSSLHVWARARKQESTHTERKHALEQCANKNTDAAILRTLLQYVDAT